MKTDWTMMLIGFLLKTLVFLHWTVGLLTMTGPEGGAALTAVSVDDPDGAVGRAGVPVCAPISLNAKQIRAAGEGRLFLKERQGRTTGGPLLPAQFERSGEAKGTGRLWWLMPPGRAGRRTFVLTEERAPVPVRMRARKDAASGQIDIRDADRLVLRYNCRNIEPGEIYDRIDPANRIYARARSDYIHPLYGPDGEELTMDWPPDHPHHRGIYWAWPEVDYHGERGDLHALQRVFARSAGPCVLQDGPVYAQIEAENLWKWEDREPIVRERAVIRAYRPGPHGRCIDLILRFSALCDAVALARRGTDKYGGLNIRLSAVEGQQILFHTDPVDARPRMAWAELSGKFPGGKGSVGLVVFQNRANPGYPGDWIQYPELNWFQPTFPASGTRYILKEGQPLTLRFRLWIRRGDRASEEAYADQWLAYHRVME